MSKKLLLVVSVLLLAFTLISAETVTVTNTNFSGPGSLSQAILDANASAGLTDIVFNIPGSGKIEINSGHSTGNYPVITSQVNINGSNPTGTVVLVGGAPTGPGAPVDGLVFGAGSENSIVENVNTEGFLSAILVRANAIQVKNNNFDNSFARSVYIDGAEGILIRDNTFTNNTSLSIYTSNAYSVAIFGNQVLSGNIIVSDSTFVYVGGANTGDGNLISNSSQGAEAAVLVYGTSANVQVLFNEIKNQTRGGVKLVASGTGNTVVGNAFSNNSEWDIIANSDAHIIQNTITGDALAIYAGIKLDYANGAVVQGNAIDGARIEIANSTNISVGGVGAESNSITNDPQGFSGSGAVILNGSSQVVVINNTITNNASSGVLIQNSSNNSIRHNDIHSNGRTGVRVESGVNNEILSNVIYDHNAAAGGGHDSISLLGSANNAKQPPVITSIVPEGDLLRVSGTAVEGDTVELFRSDSLGSTLTQNAYEQVGTAFVTGGTTWSQLVSPGYFSGPVAYITASATDTAKNTSEFSGVAEYTLSDGIVGPTLVAPGSSHQYSVENIPGVNYQWWVGGDAQVSGNGSSTVTITFGAYFVGGLVNVGYTDPVEGWVVKQLQVDAQ